MGKVVRSLRQAAPAPSYPVTFMNASSNDNGPGPERTPAGLVVGRDLMFTAKVTGTAGDLGYRMRVAGDLATARRLIEELQPRLILVDLAAGELAAQEALGDYRQLAGPSAWLVAVGPHVDAQRLAAARTAGCQLAWPRSKFSADLPALLRDASPIPRTLTPQGRPNPASDGHHPPSARLPPDVPPICLHGDRVWVSCKVWAPAHRL